MGGGPTLAQHGLSGVSPDDPAFLEWARKRGTPVHRGTPYGELYALMARYGYEQRDAGRRKEEKRRRAARERQEADRARKLTLPSVGAWNFGGQPTREQSDDDLRRRIVAGWRSGDSSLKAQAEAHVNQMVPIRRFYASHQSDLDRDRWTYQRHYIRALYALGGDDQPDEARVLEDVLKEEKAYLAMIRRREAQAEQAARPRLQFELLQAWARKQPMNPADDFKPGIAAYDLGIATGHVDWIDKDVKEVEQEDYTTTISYSRGKSLSFPARSIDFTGRDIPFIVEVIARRHRRSQRLVPFVIFNLDADLSRGLPWIDELSTDERALMAVPYLSLSAQVQAYYAQDPMWQVAHGLLKVLSLMSVRRALPIGAPVAATGLGTGGRIIAGGVSVGRAVAAATVFAVRTYGFTAHAAAHLGRTAYAYYLSNAVAINTYVVVGLDVTLAMSGQDMGPVSPGDSVSMAVQQADDVARAGPRTWKAIRAEVTAVEAATGRVVVKVRSLDSITDDVARARYNLGKTVHGETKVVNGAARGVDDTATNARLGKATSADVQVPRPPVVPVGGAMGKGKIVTAPVPRQVVTTRELEDAMGAVLKDLDRFLPGRYSDAALATIRGIDAEAIRESGIRPSDLAKLPKALLRAGEATRRFVNDFHNVPGFERVLLGWAKKHYWNPRWKRWTPTDAFRNGTSHVMRYATAKLDPKHVRFEWPVSINDTSWGGEVFARHVDIVVTGGAGIKPGQAIQLELKSWTSWVLRGKTASQPGGSVMQRGTVGYQLIRDTALFRPENIRWVFDGRKVTKAEVMNAFMRVIKDDPYLRQAWGGKSADPAKIRELLDKVIEVF